MVRRAVIDSRVDLAGQPVIIKMLDRLRNRIEAGKRQVVNGPFAAQNQSTRDSISRSMGLVGRFRDNRRFHVGDELRFSAVSRRSSFNRCLEPLNDLGPVVLSFRELISPVLPSHMRHAGPRPRKSDCFALVGDWRVHSSPRALHCRTGPLRGPR